MSFFQILLDAHQLLVSMTPILIVGLILYIFITRKLTAERDRSHQEAVYSMNREREANRIAHQQHQAAISHYKEKTQRQQDVIDELTGQLSGVKRFHLN